MLYIHSLFIVADNGDDVQVNILSLIRGPPPPGSNA